MKIFFCTSIDPTKGNGATIYTARVLLALHRVGLDVEVALFQCYQGATPPPEREWVPRLRDLISKGIVFKSFPIKPNVLSLVGAFMKLIVYVFRHRVYQRDVFAFRTFSFGPLTMLVKLIRPRLITMWFHDGIIEEIYFVHPDLKHRLMVMLANIMEKLGAYYVDWEYPVSEKMKGYSFNKNLQGRRGSVVLPCVVETDIFVPRSSQLLTPRNPIVVGYAGSMSSWSGFEQGCHFLAFLAKHIELELHILTEDVASAKNISTKFGLITIIESVNHNEVAGKMDLWDFALVPILRGLRTEVCSPLKATEALAKGLPIIITPSVGDFSDLVDKENIGIVFDPDRISTWPNSVDQLNKVLRDYDAISRKARQIAEEHYSWDLLPAYFRSVLNVKS